MTSAKEPARSGRWSINSTATKEPSPPPSCRGHPTHRNVRREHPWPSSHKFVHLFRPSSTVKFRRFPPARAPCVSVVARQRAGSLLATEPLSPVRSSPLPPLPSFENRNFCVYSFLTRANDTALRYNASSIFSPRSTPRDRNSFPDTDNNLKSRRPSPSRSVVTIVFDSLAPVT